MAQYTIKDFTVNRNTYNIHTCTLALCGLDLGLPLALGCFFSGQRESGFIALPSVYR
jgi:hypothetical protein